MSQLRRSTFQTGTVTINAFPQEILVKAKLLRASWVSRTYEYYPNRRVVLERRPLGSSTWQHEKVMQVSNAGWVYESFEALGYSFPSLPPKNYFDGDWRLRLLGNQTTASTTSNVIRLGTPPTLAPPGTDCRTEQAPPTVTGFAPARYDAALTRVPRTFTVQASDPCGIASWSVEYPRPRQPFSGHRRRANRADAPLLA